MPCLIICLKQHQRNEHKVQGPKGIPVIVMDGKEILQEVIDHFIL